MELAIEYSTFCSLVSISVIGMGMATLLELSLFGMF